MRAHLNKQTSNNNTMNFNKPQSINQSINVIYVYVYVYLAELQTICQIYWKRIGGLEGDKYDLERGVEIKKMEVKKGRFRQQPSKHTEK